jgi:hypothetical protein
VYSPEGKTQEGAQEGKIRNRDHVYRSATHAAPPRRPPRRSQPTTTGALDTSREQGAVTKCEHRGYRHADPDACRRASEEAWRNPFPGPAPFGGPAQGVLTTDHPSSGFPERQPDPQIAESPNRVSGRAVTPLRQTRGVTYVPSDPIFDGR